MREFGTRRSDVAVGSHATAAKRYGRYGCYESRLLREMLWLLTILAFAASVQGRAVNISNTWMLPEEGFPVFYRYFRDRISWYEADAVCQFHHANLVTVDTTAQYDAVRAYLKELDITSAVWVGLIRSNPEGDFTWTDYRGLSSDGYWSAAPDAGAAPLCAAADPAADYRWEARACGGPMVASFICELPVPQWASGSKGCMVKSLPALTILYLPESAAVQLTADCGLAGVRKVECTGNVKREELLKELSCIEDNEEAITTPAYELTSETFWAMLTEISNISQQTEDITEEIITTDQQIIEREIDIHKQTSTLIPESNIRAETTPLIEYHTVSINQDIDSLTVDDTKTKSAPINTYNMESNDIPRVPEKENYLSEEESNKIEDEKLMQHKMLHDELARLGNTDHFEKIFTQSSDHFIPPLVMAKSRLNDDMEELSVHAKQAQQFAEEHRNRYESNNVMPKIIIRNQDLIFKTTTDHQITDSENPTTSKVPTETTPKTTIFYKEKDNKDVKPMKISPKKYNEKYYDSKGKNIKSSDKILKKKIEKLTDIDIPRQSQYSTEEMIEPSTITTHKSLIINDFQPHALELSVVLKEPVVELKELKPIYSTNSDAKIYISETKYQNKEPLVTTTETKPLQTETTSESHTEIPEEVTHKIIKVTIPNDKDESNPIVLELSTLMPVFKESLKTENLPDVTTLSGISTSDISPTTAPNVSSENTTTKTNEEIPTTTGPSTTFKSIDAVTNLIMTTAKNIALSTEQIEKSTPKVITNSKTATDFATTTETKITSPEGVSVTSEGLQSQMNDTETGTLDDEDKVESVDDSDSPLLSGASEPLHRPTRSRRPQTQNHVKKFNPFRILG